MNKYFGDTEGFQLYFHNLLVCANSRDEHDKIMKVVLDRTHGINIKFIPKKVQYAVKS